MAQTRTLTPGYTVIHPNRDKPECKVVKMIVVAILLASVALMVLVIFGGWSKLEGLTPLTFVWCLAYLVLAFYVWRWSRGSSPVAASAQSIFGGSDLSVGVLGTLTLLMIPVQVLLIIFAMIGFAQGWNVELEVPIEEGKASRFAARGAAGSGLGRLTRTNHAPAWRAFILAVSFSVFYGREPSTGG